MSSSFPIAPFDKSTPSAKNCTTPPLSAVLMRGLTKMQIMAPEQTIFQEGANQPEKHQLPIPSNILSIQPEATTNLLVPPKRDEFDTIRGEMMARLTAKPAPEPTCAVGRPGDLQRTKNLRNVHSALPKFKPKETAPGPDSFRSTYMRNVHTELPTYFQPGHKSLRPNNKPIDNPLLTDLALLRQASKCDAALQTAASSSAAVASKAAKAHATAEANAKVAKADANRAKTNLLGCETADKENSDDSTTKAIAVAKANVVAKAAEAEKIAQIARVAQITKNTLGAQADAAAEAANSLSPKTQCLLTDAESFELMTCIDSADEFNDDLTEFNNELKKLHKDSELRKEDLAEQDQLLLEPNPILQEAAKRLRNSPQDKYTFFRNKFVGGTRGVW
jgi:hypothetical protein